MAAVNIFLTQAAVIGMQRLIYLSSLCIPPAVACLRKVLTAETGCSYESSISFKTVVRSILGKGAPSPLATVILTKVLKETDNRWMVNTQ